MTKPFLLVFFLFTGYFSLAQQNEICVSKVWAFQGNKEFYIPLHFSDSIDIEDPVNFLKGKTDSVIFSDTYSSRKRLPQEFAAKYFDLGNIGTIMIYNSDHELVTSAKFRQVEYFEDMIEGMFIAVFDPENKEALQLEETDLYCLSENATRYLKNIKSEEISKKQWNEKIKKKIYFDQDNLLTIKHFEIKINSSNRFSLLSIQDPDTHATSSYLIEENSGELQILKQIEKDYVIWDLLPVPISLNNKPVLLIEIVIPETDFTGYKLAVFNGNEYVFNDSMKLKL